MASNSDFEQLFREHYTQLYVFATHMVADHEACRDLVSEAFVQAYARFEEIPPPRRLAFLYSLVRNKCIDHVRHQQAQQRYAAMLEKAYEEHPFDTQETLRQQEEQLNHVYRLMQQMTPKTRLILERCYLGRKKYREVALELGISTSTVRKHMVAALKLLRQEMAKKSE